MQTSRDKLYSVIPPQQQRELYRKVFSSVEGKKVLTDMLIDLCFFDEVDNEDSFSFEEKAYLRNYANKILRKCGILRSANAELMIDALIRMPIKDS